MSNKKVPNNVKGMRKDRGAKLVDPQILRWRKALKKQGILLGKGMEHDKKRAEKGREERALPDPTKKRWF